MKSIEEDAVTTTDGLFALDGDVNDVPLPVDQQKSEIGGLQGIGKSLKGHEITHGLPVQFQHDVARLQARRLGETTLFEVGDHDAAGHGEIHLPSERGCHVVEDDPGKRMSGRSGG
jgi:hypothetical protein